jgi:hypothetical protein
LSNVDHVLSRLERVHKGSKPGVWRAACPACDDPHQALAIRVLDDGRILLKCFRQCEALDVLAAVGLTFADVMPERIDDGRISRERSPFPAVDVLRAVAFEALVVMVNGADMLATGRQNATDQARLAEAVGRIQAAMNLVEAER